MKDSIVISMDYAGYDIIDGTPNVQRHHIFGGNPNRKNSEKYGFVIPLRPDLHPNGVSAGKNAAGIDLKLKQMAKRNMFMRKIIYHDY